MGIRNAANLRFEVLGASLARYGKAQKLGLVVVDFGRQYHVLRVCLEVDMS